MNSKIRFISAMLIFGSIGIFVKNIDLSSSSIAFLRGMLGSLFLIGVCVITRKKPSFQQIRENGVLLFFSGAAIGFNWILLFQAYKYTTISNATLSYYFAPVFVMLFAPFVLKEKLTFIKAASIISAMIGLFLIVNVGSDVTEGSFNHTIGILYGLSAAVLYANVILMNKFIKNLSGIETTVIQLLLATLVLLPYVLIKDQLNLSSLSLQSGIYILILGIFHTGIAYFLYFTSFKDLKAQSIAVLSYVDPISAVVFAAVFLGESMSLIQILGGILILSSTYLSERLTA